MEVDLDKHPIACADDFGRAVPVIDIAALTSESSAKLKEIAVNEISKACCEWGFFQIINHGIPADLLEAVWQQTRTFFAASTDTKELLLRSKENPWGYYNNELTKNQRDKKEVFDFTSEGIDAIYASTNRWPLNKNLKNAMLDYLNACTRLSMQLLGAFFVGLNMPENFMRNEFSDSHTGFIRLNYYPVSDPLANATVEHQAVADMGVHHHTDAGALTLLLQDDIGGLQVYREGYWHNIPPVAGAFVVNTGDMMQVWSNDNYRAAMHRVLAMESNDRYSIPFFFNPPAETQIEPLPTVVNEENSSRYRAINWAEYRGKRTDGDYADFGAEVQVSHYRK